MSPSNDTLKTEIAIVPSELGSKEKFDVALYFEKGKTLTAENCDAELESLMKNVWVPSASFTFPLTESCGKNRHFKLSWLKDYKWLTYSKQEDGAYCIYCTLLGSGVVDIQKKKTELFFFKSYKCWANAKKSFRNHDKSQFHKACEGAASALQSRCESSAVGIGTHLNRMCLDRGKSKKN